MSLFWSLYVGALTLDTLLALAWLLLSTRKGQRSELTEQTVGHAFDGIEEYDNPLPRWWFWLFVGTLAFALGYLLLYPGLGNWKGLLPGYQDGAAFSDGQPGWTGVHEWEREVAAAEARFGPIFARFAALPIEEVAQDPKALSMGARLFASNCALCHGSDAKGAFGFPNLTDAEWRWGGDPESIRQSILNGRQGVMPAWGAVLGEQGINDVAAFITGSLGGRDVPEGVGADPVKGKQIFATSCVACHGPEGRGMPMLGAPDLTRPQAFIYGSSFAQLQQTIRNGRQGQMPAQAQLHGNDKVHLLAAYVYSLSRAAQEQPPAEQEP